MVATYYGDEDNSYVGDLIRLRGGSPELVVTDVDPCDNVHVAWFNNGELEHAVLPAKCLELI